jgi:hypothetical protein
MSDSADEIAQPVRPICLGAFEPTARQFRCRKCARLQILLTVPRSCRFCGAWQMVEFPSPPKENER